MITNISASKRHLAKYEWLKTYHLFSFADYFDPLNLQFGVLRVFNDDTIGAFSGFDEHGHDNMEIVTIVLQGQLTHRDSLGNTTTIKAGEVQRMSAGTGVVHAEKNLADEPVHLYQLWFLPEAKDLVPSYAQRDFSYREKNRLVPIVSNKTIDDTLQMSADATIYLAELEEGKELRYSIVSQRGVFMYIQTGELEINGHVFETGDQARIESESELLVRAKQEAKFICIEVGGF